jgi:hypothetical protein
MLEIIGIFFKLLFTWFNIKMEQNASKKKMKEDAFKEVTNGIKKGDTSAITSGFDRINRL